MKVETEFFTEGNYRVYIDRVFVGRYLLKHDDDHKDRYYYRQNPEVWVMSAAWLQAIVDNLNIFNDANTTFE